MSIPALDVRIPHLGSTVIPIRPEVPSEWDQIFHCTPDHEFVYVFRDSLERVLYVGITWSAKARWRHHKRKKSWWLAVASAELTCCTNVRAALTLEMQLIKELKPMHNKRGVSI